MLCCETVFSCTKLTWWQTENTSAQCSTVFCLQLASLVQSAVLVAVSSFVFNRFRKGEDLPLSCPYTDLRELVCTIVHVLEHFVQPLIGHYRNFAGHLSSLSIL